ncbi:MAG: efflux RND transporter permease subunit, partial [Kiloniellales bacterium]
MNLIRLAIDRPIAVISAVLMVVLFGVLALTRIPIQLAPDVQRPVISVRTSWAGAAPAEVEREIVNRQEDVLKGLEGVVEVRSGAETGRGRVTLEFEIGTNMDRAMLLVSNRLSEVSGYPDEVDEPRLDTSGTDDNPIAWFTLTRLSGNERPIYEYGDFAEDVIQDRLERVPGVSSTNVFGESAREIQVTVDPQLLAHYRLTVSDVIDKIREGNASVSAGDVEEGKRRYVVRTEGELDTLDAVRHVVLRTEEDSAT